jgi:hypothetical protein
MQIKQTWEVSISTVLGLGKKIFIFFCAPKLEALKEKYTKMDHFAHRKVIH